MSYGTPHLLTTAKRETDLIRIPDKTNKSKRNLMQQTNLRGKIGDSHGNDKTNESKKHLCRRQIQERNSKTRTHACSQRHIVSREHTHISHLVAIQRLLIFRCLLHPLAPLIRLHKHLSDNFEKFMQRVSSASVNSDILCHP